MGDWVEQRTFRLDKEDIMDNIARVGWEDGCFSDITVVIKGQEFKLHRMVINRSPYFRTLFGGSWNDSEQQVINIKADDPLVTARAFNDVMGTLYGRPLQIDGLSVRHIFATASYFGMTEIAIECVAFITSQLSPYNIVDYIAFAKRCEYGQSQDILEACEAYLCQNAYQDNEMRARLQDVQLFMVVKTLKSDNLWVPSEYERYCFAKDVLMSKITNEDDIQSLADSVAEMNAFNRPGAHRAPGSSSADVSRYTLLNGRDTGLYPSIDLPMPEIEHNEKKPEVGKQTVKSITDKKIMADTGAGSGANDGQSVETALIDVLKSGIYYAHIDPNEVLDVRKDINVLHSQEVSDAFQKGMCQARMLQLLIEKAAESTMNVSAGLLPSDVPPPFRFSVQFSKALGYTDRLLGYSDKYYYGGSFWWLTCIRHCVGERNPNTDNYYYGIFLHRDNMLKYPRPPYKDPRDRVQVWYTFRCMDVITSATSEIVKNVGQPDFILASKVHQYLQDGSLFVTVSLQLLFD